MKNKISFVKLMPGGRGWTFRFVRKNRVRDYIPTDPRLKRVEKILNSALCSDDPNAAAIQVELGRTGWAEIEIYP